MRGGDHTSSSLRDLLNPVTKIVLTRFRGRGAGFALAKSSRILRPSNGLPFSFIAYTFQTTTKDTSSHISTSNVTNDSNVKKSNLPSELLLQKQTLHVRFP